MQKDIDAQRGAEWQREWGGGVPSEADWTRDRNNWRGGDAARVGSAVKMRRPDGKGWQVRARVARSGVAGAGLGLRAARNMRAEEVAVGYGGEWVGTQEAEARLKLGGGRGDYILGVVRGRCLDGWGMEAGGQLVNDPLGSDRSPTARFWGGTAGLVIRTTRSVLKGEELLVDYGGVWWAAEEGGVSRAERHDLVDEEAARRAAQRAKGGGGDASEASRGHAQMMVECPSVAHLMSHFAHFAT